MIFIYPAIVTKNVDRRYLPAAIKSIELYLLHHIVESVATGSLRFKITQNFFTRKFSEMRLESLDSDTGLDLLLENPTGTYPQPSRLPQIPGNHPTSQPRNPNVSLTSISPTSDVNEMLKQNTQQLDIVRQSYDNAAAQLATSSDHYRNTYLTLFDEHGNPRRQDYTPSDIEVETANAAKQNYEDNLRQMDNFSRILGDLAKQRSILTQLKKEREFLGGANVRIDTTMVTDLRPTAVSVEADIMVKKYDKFILPTMDRQVSKMIPISVKVIPIYIEDFTDISHLLLNDMFTNNFSGAYRTFVRSSASVILRWFKPVFHKILDSTMPGDVNIWRDMILSKKGLVDASTFSGRLMHGKYKKYAASIIVMSVNDIRKTEEDWFTKPKKVNRLFSMGWNSFAVMDDPGKKMTFCCEYDDGLCNILPYNYMFKALMASDLYKELDDLNKFTAPMMRGLKSPGTVFASLDKKPSLEVQEHEPKGLKQNATDRVKNLLKRFTG